MKVKLDKKQIEAILADPEQAQQAGVNQAGYIIDLSKVTATNYAFSPTVSAARSKAEKELAEYRKSFDEQKATLQPAQKQTADVAVPSDTPIQFYFDYNVTRPIPDEENEIKLSNLCAAMQKDETIRVVVTGHTDNVGTKRNNLKVGYERAVAIKRMMTELGAPSQNITVATCGEQEPAEPNDTQEGRAKNRRVIVKFK